MTKKEAKALKAEYNKRVKEMKAIRSQLHCAYAAFDSVTDPDMMDACIFEISALKSRYNYAVANIKNLNQ
ncbi:MAG: hypothetical protein SPJ63_06000 [Oscillospiraceae bacterium]|nr:hypothetical protein [Oscillospiraceae bacterium]